MLTLAFRVVLLYSLTSRYRFALFSNLNRTLVGIMKQRLVILVALLIFELLGLRTQRGGASPPRPTSVVGFHWHRPCTRLPRCQSAQGRGEGIITVEAPALGQLSLTGFNRCIKYWEPCFYKIIITYSRIICFERRNWIVTKITSWLVHF